MRIRFFMSGKPQNNLLKKGAIWYRFSPERYRLVPFFKGYFFFLETAKFVTFEFKIKEIV